MPAPKSFQRIWILITASLLVCLAGVTRGQEASKVAPAGKAAPAPAPVAKAPAKQYAEVTLPDPGAWKPLRAKLFERGEPENDAEMKIFIDHYKSLASELTQHSTAGKLSEQGEKIAKVRVQIKTDLLNLARKKSTILHDALVDQLARVLPSIFSSDKYHPVTRINCLLLYGDLNSKEGDTTLVPLATAYPVMMKIFTNATQPAYLRCVALVGIARHAEIGLPPENRKELGAEMIKVLKTPPPGFKPEVVTYLRFRAVDVLRSVIAKGESGSRDIAEALKAVVLNKNKSEDVSLELRCEALRAIGGLDAKAIDPADIPLLAQAAAKLAVDIAQQSAPPAQPEDDAESPSAAGRVPAPAPNNGGNVLLSATDDSAAPTPEGEAASAAADAAPVGKPSGVLDPDIQTYLFGCIQIGLNGVDSKRGLAAAAKDDSKKLVVEITTKLNDMLRITKPKARFYKLSEEEIDKINKTVEELEPLAGA